MTATVQEIANRMLALLPDDGTPVLNRVMRVMLSRELATTVTEDQFFAARDKLLDKGRIGRLRGQGGQIFLLKDRQASEELPPPAPEFWSEAALMPRLQRYLDGPFRRNLELPEGSACIIQDTSTMGPVRGRWARPDFILIAARRFKYVPTPQLDVHSFELKNERGVDDLAVYEALAQTRFTHFGHLVWHLPSESKSETRLLEIEKQCEQHGIGLIRIREPEDPSSFEVLLDPVRKETAPGIVDDFLDLRLNASQREDVCRALNGENS
ncbi:MAG TPA: hypothetical protein VHA55_03135 [Pseudorhodoplanes sp.]|nr:hypothetical protein [Pseudorhodoplanes sp.]